MAINVLAVSIDGSDITRLAEFWADVLDQPVSPAATDGFAAITIREGLRLLFHQVPEGKVVKNRVHLDLAATDYEAETDRLIKLGAVRLHDFDIAEGGSRWRTFADPEGNEFDLVSSAA
jgi:predicted enzyme related to lactoylglutathione lyase